MTTPYCEIENSCHYVHIFFKFILDNPQNFGELKGMNISKFLGKLNKNSIANLNRQHQTSWDFIFNKRCLWCLVHIPSSFIFAYIFQKNSSIYKTVWEKLKIYPKKHLFFFKKCIPSILLQHYTKSNFILSKLWHLK